MSYLGESAFLLPLAASCESCLKLVFGLSLGFRGMFCKSSCFGLVLSQDFLEQQTHSGRYSLDLLMARTSVFSVTFCQN